MIIICILLLICVKSAFVTSGSLDPPVTSDVTSWRVCDDHIFGCHGAAQGWRSFVQSGKSLLQPVSLVESNFG